MDLRTTTEKTVTWQEIMVKETRVMDQVTKVLGPETLDSKEVKVMARVTKDTETLEAMGVKILDPVTNNQVMVALEAMATKVLDLATKAAIARVTKNTVIESLFNYLSSNMIFRLPNRIL